MKDAFCMLEEKEQRANGNRTSDDDEKIKSQNIALNDETRN